MGWWQISTDVLADSRFVISELAETTACLRLLDEGAATNPAEHAWLDRHLPAYRSRLRADPITASLVTAALGRTTRWTADFVTPPPTGDQAFDEELDVIRATDPASARADLVVSVGGPPPPELDRDDLPERLAGLLSWINTEAVRPYWSQRRRILEADILARTSGLGLGGWAATFDDMRPGMRWLGEGRLQINAADYPPKSIADSTLFFVPVTPRRGWVSWNNSNNHYAVIYPCNGVLADPRTSPPPEALARLLGPARAAVLRLLGTPLSTTHLVALTDQRLGSVGRHLRVLLDAGLVARRRAGRSVLYQRTHAGDILVSATEPSP